MARWRCADRASAASDNSDDLEFVPGFELPRGKFGRGYRLPVQLDYDASRQELLTQEEGFKRTRKSGFDGPSVCDDSGGFQA
jgi:hypothetical protein